MIRYEEINRSKEEYQNDLLFSSYEKKFKALTRLQEKAKFFDKIKYSLSESFGMDKIISILEDLKENGLVIDYVIGGATALLYYSTPHLTEDIDVFISINNSSKLISLSPIYEFLKDNYDAKPEREYLLIKGNPIQFLMPGDKLTKEAFDNAKKIKIKGKEFKIFSLEYLIAIMLYLNKPKYRERLRIVKEENQYNIEELTKVLKKYNLLKKWNKIGDLYV